MSEVPGEQELSALVAEIRRRPKEFALFCDLDGTLAPIVARPEEVEVPEVTRNAIDEAARRLGLCAIVTGRPAREARELIGVDSVVVAGNHGLELLEADSGEITTHELLAGHENEASEFLDSLDREELDRVGIRIEDKGAIIALHWRGAEDSRDLREAIERTASRAREVGLDPRGGRMVLELRPRVAIDKGVAVAGLIDSRPDIDSAVFIGDDSTDLDAFDALDLLAARGRLSLASKIAVVSEETAGLDLSDRADISLSGPAEVADLIARMGD